MNRKQLILLLVALAVIGGAGLLLLQRNQKSWTASEEQIGRKLLPNFQVNDVAAIHIKGETDLTLEHKDDGWHVPQRGGYPASVTQIKELLLKMADLKVAQSDPIGPSQLARLHLAPPGPGADAATLLEFKGAQGKTLASLLLGKKHMEESERRPRMPFGDEGFANGRYVMLESDPKTVLTISDALNSADPKPAEWLDKDFFKVEKPQTITFVSTNATNSWKIARASEAASWELAEPKAGEAFDSNKVSALASTLTSPSFVDVAADPAPDKTGLDQPLTVTIETFDHFTYTLKIGHKTPENDYNFAFTVTADLPAARTPGKDEKADEKTKLDKEFQEKTKTLQERLKQEQSLSKWTYLVNGWLVDPYIRDRSQLMVDKKTDKKEDEAAPETDHSPEIEHAPPGSVMPELLPTAPK
jgi:hypothetical protein